MDIVIFSCARSNSNGSIGFLSEYRCVSPRHNCLVFSYPMASPSFCCFSLVGTGRRAEGTRDSVRFRRQGPVLPQAAQRCNHERKVCSLGIRQREDTAGERQ